MKLLFTFFSILILSLHSFAQSSFKVFSINQSLIGGNVVADGRGQYGYAAQGLSREQTGSLLVGKLNADLSFNWYHLFTDSAHNFQSGTKQPIIACHDGGFVITAFDGTYDGVLTVLKTNAAGTLLWSKRYNINIFTYASNLVEAPDGSLLVVNHFAPPTSQGPASIVRINGKNGNLIWMKTLAMGNTCSIGCIALTRDTGFIVGGAGNARDGDFTFIAKYNAKGIVEWKRVFRSPVQGNAYSQFIGDIKQALDGGYIYTGQAPSTNTNNIYDLSVVKLTSAGDIEWAKTIGSDGPGEEYGNNIYQNADSSYTIIGAYNTYSGCVVKLDKTGQSLLQSVIDPGFLYGNVGIPDGKGGFLCAGTFYSGSKLTKQSSYIARVDSLGLSCTGSLVQQPILDMAISRITLASTSADVTNSVTTDTAYFTTTPVPVFSNILCQEQNIAGDPASLVTSANEAAVNTVARANVYPNPASSSLQIRLPGKAVAWQVRVTDMSGKALFSKQYTGVTDFIQTIDISGWAKGLYIVTANHNGISQVLKVMKSR